MGRWMFECICGWCVQSWVTKWTLYMKSCRFFCFFSWHSRFGTWFWSRLEQKSGQKSRFQPHKNKKEWKRSRKSEPRLGKQLRKSSGKTSTWHSDGPDQILYSVSSSLPVSHRFASTSSPAFTLQHKNRKHRVFVRRFAELAVIGAAFPRRYAQLMVGDGHAVKGCFQNETKLFVLNK